MILYGQTCRSGLLEVRKGVLSSCFGVGRVKGILVGLGRGDN